MNSGQPWLFPVLIALGWGVVLGALGGWLTVLDEWYRQLRFPTWKPPDWAFGPVWSTIFLLSGTAFVFAWRAAGPGNGRSLLLLAYAANGALNLLWSWLFFRQHRPDQAFVEAFALWLSIAGMMAAVGTIVPWTALLVLPYLAWVTLATRLTQRVVQLNGPFTG